MSSAAQQPKGGKKKKKTALESRRVRQSSPTNSAQAPGLIIGAEQSRARTKQVLCNQQLAVACDELQSQPELSLLHANTNTHKLNTASATHTHTYTYTYTRPNKQDTFSFSYTSKHTLDCLDLEAQHL